MNILLIEDDAILNDTIAGFLGMNKHQVTCVNDGSMAIEEIDHSVFDLFIIDINIPNVDGLSIVRYIRQKDLKTPIIMITASMELENFKTAYENGCDDYIKKPFYLEELEIRIDKLIESSLSEKPVIQISENLRYDFNLEELTVNGIVKRLRKKEKRLLTLFLHNINKTLPTEKIENYVWENEIRDSYPLRQLVNELRKQLGNNEKFIFSDRGVGYKFEIKN